ASFRRTKPSHSKAAGSLQSSPKVHTHCGGNGGFQKFSEASMQAQPLNAEVLVAAGPIVAASRHDMALLKARALESPRRRTRLCAHQNTHDRLHEMLIVLGHGSYIRPHKHPGKTESFHIIEGRADLVFFNDDGGIWQVLTMGEYESGRTFYYRLCAPYFH